MKNKHITRIIALFMFMLVLISAFSLSVFATDGASDEVDTGFFDETNIFGSILGVIFAILYFLFALIINILFFALVLIFAIIMLPILLIALLFGFGQALVELIMQYFPMVTEWFTGLF